MTEPDSADSHSPSIENESADAGSETATPLAGRHICFIGKLGGLARREAFDLVRQHHGIPHERITAEVDLVVLGAEHLGIDEFPSLWNDALQAKLEAGKIEVISESELWHRLGMVESQQEIKHLFTPAMLADLLKVSVRTIRRWHRLGLIHPTRVVHRLAYFDFREVQSARRVAKWISEGIKPEAIKRQLSFFSRWIPDLDRPVEQLDVILEGRKLLLRQGEGLIESDGQMRIDFGEPSQAKSFSVDNNSTNHPILDFHQAKSQQVALDQDEQLAGRQANATHEWTQDEILEQATDLEDEGRLEEAIEWYRIALTRFGPSPENHFQLAELLYRVGETTAARERYYAALEMDENFVEARANLGCVLHETGRFDLAIASFRGTLQLHEEYADVHYHLARALDEIDHRTESKHHWQRFLELAPDSPWAQEAIDRLEETSTTK